VDRNEILFFARNSREDNVPDVTINLANIPISLPGYRRPTELQTYFTPGEIKNV
jgi:hypothetical protein